MSLVVGVRVDVSSLPLKDTTPGEELLSGS